MAQESERRTSEQMSSAAHTLGDTAKKAGEQVRHEGMRVLDVEKSATAKELGKVGSALESAAKQLHESNSPIAEWADTTSRMVQRASHDLSERNIKDLVGTLDGYARQHPALVVGGLFLTGVLSSRFFRETSPEEGESRQ
jgi:hypothetical protein